jgi:hypothetical protein
MPNLDSCINDLFEPGNIATDSGTISTPQFAGYELTSDGARVAIISDTPPPGLVWSSAIVLPAFFVVGDVQLSGSY